MKIGVDFHVVQGIYQGSRSYMIELYSHLVPLAGDVEFYFCLDRPEVLPSLSTAFTLPNVHAVRLKQSNPLQRVVFQLPLIQRRYGFDLFHTQYVMPMLNYSPGIVSIHDIIFEIFPEFFTHFFNLRSKILIRRSARKALHIFTISEFSKNAMIEKYGLQPSKITVTYCGVNAKRFYPGKEGEEAIVKRGLSSGGYLLSVGRIEPRKNYVNLLKAYSEAGHDLPPLVIIGQEYYKSKTLKEAISALSLNKRVKILNDIGDEELPAFYRHAKMFLYPSWAEGFGIPVVEAMASGAPVICSNTTAFPEVAEGAACLIDPGDYRQLSHAINSLLRDEHYQNMLRKNGLARARSFSWQATAEKTLAGIRAMRNGNNIDS